MANTALLCDSVPCEQEKRKGGSVDILYLHDVFEEEELFT